MSEKPWTLHLGDCLDPVAGLASLPDRSVDHVITDPPYGVNFAYSEHEDDPDAHIKLVAGFMPHVLRLFRACAVVLSGTAHAFLYPPPLWMCAWIKPGSTRNSRLGGFCEFEPMLVYGKPENRVYHDFCYMPSIANIFKGQIDHPCPKPEALMEWIVREFTKPGDLILDPFAGSGTTGVAAVRLGRRFIGWERDPKYHAVATRRLESTREQLNLLAPRTKPKQETLL